MNKTKMKRLTCFALFLFLTGAMVFATGGRQQAAATGTPTLQIGIQRNANVTDFRDNYLTRYLEKLHNISFDFYELPAAGGDARSRVALLTASNDLPETIWGGELSGSSIMEYGSQGFFISLNRYFSDPSKTPYFNKIPEADRILMLAGTRSADGNNYAFMQYAPNTWNITGHRLWINRTFLDKLGLQVPRTTDELRNVLIAFRDGDPNGNGRRDEIGVFGSVNYYGINVIKGLINSFIYYHGTLALDSTGNNVISPVIDPNFRKALQYLNGLYREGLLEASIFTVDLAGAQALINADPPIGGFIIAGNFSNFPNGFNAMTPILPGPLTGPDGVAYSPVDQQLPVPVSYITNKARDVDLAVKVMDSFYEETLSLTGRYGEENVDWTRDPALLRGRTNAYVYSGLYPALTMGVINAAVWNMPNAQIWGPWVPRYFSQAMSETMVAFEEAPIDPATVSTNNVAINAQYYIPRRPQYLLPPLVYSLDDLRTLSPIATDIDNYVNQSIAEFVTSARDINSDTAWNAYLRELDNMGLQQWLRTAQATYNGQR